MKHHRPALFVLLTLTLAPRIGSGQPHADDATWLPTGQVTAFDLAPRVREPWLAPDPGGTRLTVGLQAQQHSGRQDLGGTVWLTLPTDRLARRKAKRPASREAPPVHSPGPSRPPALSTRTMHEAIDAALAHAHLDRAEARLDDMAARARWSAALPQLRLRVTRLIDESSSLSPTSYDPSRMTARGGSSLWLEARGTWHLDRLLFANEEMAIARQQERLDAQRRTIPNDVIGLLHAWQAARLAQRDPLLGAADCRAAWIEEQRAAAKLNWMTGGWHARHRRRRPAPPRRCDLD